MDYTYNANGDVGVRGKSESEGKKIYHFRFSPGKTLYFKNKARQGVLERLTIKKLRVVSNQQTGFIRIPIYVDTMNALFNESELCSLTEAVQTAIQFYEARIASVQNYAKKTLQQGLDVEYDRIQSLLQRLNSIDLSGDMPDPGVDIAF